MTTRILILLIAASVAVILAGPVSIAASSFTGADSGICDFFPWWPGCP